MSGWTGAIGLGVLRRSSAPKRCALERGAWFEARCLGQRAPHHEDGVGSGKGCGERRPDGETNRSNVYPGHQRLHGEVLGAKRRASNHALPTVEALPRPIAKTITHVTAFATHPLGRFGTVPVRSSPRTRGPRASRAPALMRGAENEDSWSSVATRHSLGPRVRGDERMEGRHSSTNPPGGEGASNPMCASLACEGEVGRRLRRATSRARKCAPPGWTGEGQTSKRQSPGGGHARIAP
jgi:hypothetical protein